MDSAGGGGDERSGAFEGDDASGGGQQQQQTRSFSFKVVLLGEGCVGKTSLVLRYVEDKFNERHISTVQASFLQKKINVSGNRVTQAIWDTAGQEKFHALGPIYYRHSNGAILVYDITDKDSFEKVKIWVKELKKMLGNEICLCIAGNKSDLERERTVSTEEAESYAAMVGATHFYTSAKLNHNIEELFLHLTEQMITSSLGTERKQTGRRNVVVVEQEQPPSPRPTSKGCCG
ncbi:ras-related protein Rab-21 [Folsomia candida]|uniref:Ras-related protein Rab-21 n=1 Tax=Folsomia candida TaxID=158441 RepID=A0A226E4G8_FOLCA|nr:ras-related protein Rab-21 [Folsomia candida]XP_021954247.1 ras-related protein Rab-21 [Folsomia candida]XP_021954249.1 ras-related protein Rab-21 [Folsomia candida]OXA52625.1 Ras-related protein Rab-21 [Folsomia candida]